jgi:hypothetical protein
MLLPTAMALWKERKRREIHQREKKERQRTKENKKNFRRRVQSIEHTTEDQFSMPSSPFFSLPLSLSLSLSLSPHIDRQRRERTILTQQTVRADVSG